MKVADRLRSHSPRARLVARDQFAAALERRVDVARRAARNIVPRSSSLGRAVPKT